MRSPRSPSILAAALISVAALSGCAHQAIAGSGDRYGYDSRNDGWRGDTWRGDGSRVENGRGDTYRPGDGRIAYGTVVAIAEGDRDSSRPSVGTGAVLGGAVGAILGRRMGTSVEAKNAGTLIGGVIGALAGHQFERSRGRSDGINVTVRLDNGSTVTLQQDRNEELRVGDKVQIVDSRITRLARRGPRDLEYGHS
jgi:outer membrane lipoprotein SlyB